MEADVTRVSALVCRAMVMEKGLIGWTEETANDCEGKN